RRLVWATCLDDARALIDRWPDHLTASRKVTYTSPTRKRGSADIEQSPTLNSDRSQLPLACASG
ncbi:MAG: hypothetical protein SGJ19_11965, partial [Planctomycetia bacterium]|nr:hypothetical protein [Planctomycetia bacterium]